MNSVRGIFLFVTVISYGFIYKKWRQRDGGEKSPGWNGYMETIWNGYMEWIYGKTDKESVI